MLQSDWLSYSYTISIWVQWLPVVHEMRCFYSFLEVFEVILDLNGELHLPRTVLQVQLCLRVKFNNAWENHWKPLFALISVRILLKQLHYEAIAHQLSPHRNLELAHNLIVKYNQNLQYSLFYLWPDQKFKTSFMTWLLHQNPVSDLHYN